MASVEPFSAQQTPEDGMSTSTCPLIEDSLLDLLTAKDLQDLPLKDPLLQSSVGSGELPLGLDPMDDELFALADDGLFESLKVTEETEESGNREKKRKRSRDSTEKKIYKKIPDRMVRTDIAARVNKYLNDNPEGHWANALKEEELIGIVPTLPNPLLTGACHLASEIPHANKLDNRMGHSTALLNSTRGSFGREVLEEFGLQRGLSYAEFQATVKEKEPDVAKRMLIWGRIREKSIEEQSSPEAKEKERGRLRSAPSFMEQLLAAKLVKGQIAPSSHAKRGNECLILVHNSPPPTLTTYWFTPEEIMSLWIDLSQPSPPVTP